jgi:hypothetical protein
MICFLISIVRASIGLIPRLLLPLVDLSTILCESLDGRAREAPSLEIFWLEWNAMHFYPTDPIDQIFPCPKIPGSSFRLDLEPSWDLIYELHMQ